MKKSLIFLGSLGLFLSGCLQNSPLLNHADADQLNSEASVTDARCPISFSKSGFCASWTWQKQQTEEEGGESTLRFWSKKDGTEGGPYLDPGYTVAVKLWMAAMGHGSSPVKVTPVKDSHGESVKGVFDSKEIFFSMPGKWEIWIQFKKDGKVVEQSKLDYTWNG